MYFNKAYNCVFTSNTAREDGGAIYMTTAYNSTFNKNSAGEGGAIYMATAYNSTFTENDAGEGGEYSKDIPITVLSQKILHQDMVVQYMEKMHTTLHSQKTVQTVAGQYTMEIPLTVLL